MLYVPRRLRDSNEKVLASVRPNAGVSSAFYRKLHSLIEQMHREAMDVLTTTYQENPPEMAQDALSSAELRNAMSRLASRWLGQFDLLAHRMAEYFAQDVSERSDGAMMRMLKQAGFTVAFSFTPAMRDVFESIVHENVSLIKSIPQQYLNQVEGLVMRSVQTGRDLKTLQDELLHRYTITKKRAALIARDQNNKATSALTRVRQTELGIKQAIWQHSHAGKEPRPTHVKMDGHRYDIDKGMYDSHEGKYVFPGELINCRCTSRPIVFGL